MKRHGVVIVSKDPAFKRFVDSVLLAHAPEERPALQLASGALCVAIIDKDRAKKLVLVDGEPVDIAVGALIDAVRRIDSEVPCVVVRKRRAGSLPFASPRLRAAVHVMHGASRTGLELFLAYILRAGGAAST